MIQIKNLRNDKPKNEWDIKIDRSSILGNPFYMKDESKRGEVCDKYERYFYDKIKTDDDFNKEIMRLCNIYHEYGKLNLFCWCAPKRCHAETIAKFIRNGAQYEAN